ncbi:signal peptidase I [Brevibacillus fulvus]|uniref:Signal peptidase I n=1 Tax=Brevibacillus fulvus TaxID=1125967 RepID=A0A939BVG8_9BACL|nr:signal peptidase I [Brevibacillus fulvus]
MSTVKEVLDWIKSLVIALIFAILISIFVFQPYKVDGHSMDPTLYDQERIFVSKLSHTFSYYPDYGDIVIIDSRVERKRSLLDDILENPIFSLIMGTSDTHTFYVKRVIGKPGDVLEFKDHKVYRNGVALDEPYIKEPMEFVSDDKWVVPDGHIFVMGDNRNNSLDSREIGYIPLDHVMGEKLFGNGAAPKQ